MPMAASTSAACCQCASCRWCPVIRETRSELARQDHSGAVALHLDPVEEAHAEQRYVEPVFHHDGIDVEELDGADAHAVEPGDESRCIAVGGLHRDARAAAIVNAEAHRIGGRNRHRGGAGVDEEADMAAVDLALGDEMAARVGGERRALAAGRRRCAVAAVMDAPLEHALLALDLERGALA